MERLRQLVCRLLFPPLAVLVIGVPAAAALLVYIFTRGREDSPLAYASYVFSAYVLTALCARLWRWVSSSGRSWKESIHRNPIAHRYLTDVSFKVHASLYLSLGLNLLFAAMKLVFGVLYRSVWFGTLAVYYIMLALMRFLLLRHVNRSGFGSDQLSQLKQYRLCGGILLLMNTALSGVVVLVVRKNESFHYAGYLIYVVALYAFYNIISAVTGAVRYRACQSPVMSAAKNIKLAAALVSMLALETAMLDQFGGQADSPLFRPVMTGVTGGCVCTIVLAMALYMLTTSKKQIFALERSSAQGQEGREQHGQDPRPGR